MNSSLYSALIILINTVRPLIALICVLSLVTCTAMVITWVYKLRFLRESGRYFRRVNLINEYLDKEGAKHD